MASTQPNPLLDSGKPLFFKVGHPGDLLGRPAIRRGEAIRLQVRSLSAMQKEALVFSARTGVCWRLASDEGAYLAGLDTAPCPLSFLTTGMISSYMNEILALAEQRGIPIDGIRLIQDNYYTMVGSALEGTMTGGARDVDLTAQIASSADRDTLSVLVLDATAASPLNGLMRGSKESLFTLTHNGREIAPALARPLGRPAEPDPSDRFELAAPAPGDWSESIRKGEPTPRAEHTVTLAGDSLAAEQHRLLHVRGICTLRPDGVKQIEQQLFNPHGSIFYFLSDEAPENGGRGRAPDAMSYASAGIGFCFMTQFGRYAQIVKKDLRRYRIVQDTHFSLGGASGGTGEAGRADPIETHVYLETGEDDDFARTILDRSEQTCFLHAFCKADLKVKVSIRTYSDRVEAPAGIVVPA
jgi:OsmC-like protein